MWIFLAIMDSNFYFYFKVHDILKMNIILVLFIIIKKKKKRNNNNNLFLVYILKHEFDSRNKFEF